MLNPWYRFVELSGELFFNTLLLFTLENFKRAFHIVPLEVLKEFSPHL